ncbi:response regulator transcription factor [Nocardiopsis sp. MG754419]|uniref:response regulator n=1 Tax=Nocardiopsis sp. MG754419 TaxID=2259865 RepID=UPI001BAC950D|nr:response regulator transcription factor [Nocardiopsis sp. MG754419]MBR8745043.1 DNA-binding response regulator [Nocardiopsis sp. MG754419]
MIRMGLVDDQRLFTAGMAMVIDSQHDMAVAWQAGDGAEAVDRQRDDPVDLVLMDVQMPGTDGLTATRALVSSGERCRIVVLTTFDTDEYVVEAIEAGAAGFLLKNTPPEELLSALRTVHGGDAVVSASSTGRLLRHVRPLLGGRAGPTAPPDRSTRRALESLTPREREILAAVARGRTNTEICASLVLSMPTVKTHVGHILAKTGSRDRVQAVLFAFRSGLVDRADLLRDARPGR